MECSDTIQMIGFVEKVRSFFVVCKRTSAKISQLRKIRNCCTGSLRKFRWISVLLCVMIGKQPKV